MICSYPSRIAALLRFVLPLLIASAGMAADAVAVLPVGGDSGTDQRPFVIGWEFSVSTPTVVTGLSYLDATGRGLAESHMVGIFNALDGSLLVSATVPAGAAGKFVDGFRVTPVSYNLAPGTYVIGGQKATNSDYAIVRSSSQISIPGIKYMEERELETDTFMMPSTHFALNRVLRAQFYCRYSGRHASNNGDNQCREFPARICSEYLYLDFRLRTFEFHQVVGRFRLC